jgi:hypothetical protein
MVLDLSVEEFIKMIGHDGSAEPYPAYPGQKAGFHEQECIEVVQQLGYACTPIEIVPQIMPMQGGPTRPIWFPMDRVDDPEGANWQRFLRHLDGSYGVLTGVRQRINSVKSLGHAVAWDGHGVYDPQGDGFLYNIDEASDFGFIPRNYWKIQEVRYA